MVYRIAALDIKALLHELRDLVEGAFIRNIYQKDEAFLFKLWTEDGKKHLLINAGERFNLTRLIETGIATDFARGLRRHLRGKKIRRITQLKLDRIIKISVGNEYTLLVEFFNRGNFILLKNEEIILAQKHQHMRDRSIYPGKKYEFPPQSPPNPLKMPMKDFIAKIRDRKDLVRGLVGLLGPKYAEELCYQIDIDKNIPSNKLKESHFHILIGEIKEIFSTISDNPEPNIYYKKGGIPLHYTPIPFKSLKEYSSKRFDSFSNAIDQFYIAKERKTGKSERAKKIAETKEKLQRRIKEQEQKIRSFKKKAKEYREQAKSIYNHLRELSLILEKIKSAKREKNLSWKQISQQIPKWNESKLIESVHQDGNVRISLDNIKITLNMREKPQERAERYFSKAKKIRERLSRTRIELEKTRSKLQQIKEEGEKREEKDKIRVKMPQRQWFEKFRWFKSSDDFLILAGKNAKSNEELIKHHLEEEDLFLHAEVQGGAATIIKKKKGKEIPNTTIKEAAIFAGSFSKAWEEGFAGIDVYYTPAEKVSLSPPSGEYLPKGGFMIKEKNYVSVELKTTVGVSIKELGENILSVREIGGPPSAISKRTKLYITLKPGKGKGKGRIAKEIKRQLQNLTKDKKEKKAIEKLKKEKFLRFIPTNSIIKED